MNRQRFVTSSLPLPETIAYITSVQLREICDRISVATLERCRNDLIDLNISQFSYQMYSGVYDRISAECIWQYRQLIKQLGKPIAETQIKQHLQEYFND